MLITRRGSTSVILIKINPTIDVSMQKTYAQEQTFENFRKIDVLEIKTSVICEK